MSVASERRPAVLGGRPVFEQPLGIVAPRLPVLEEIAGPVSEALHTGAMTNNSRNVREFENALAERLQAPYVLAVCNATLGLMLALKALGLSGEVVVPSFTFSATAHAVEWCGLKPVFADILPDTFTLDPRAVEAAITPQTCAILAVHIYGHPCEIDELQATARSHGLPLVIDSAHAFGSRYRGQPVGGFGDAEVFSFHATKVFPVGEGGCVATRRADVADYVALARKFGDPGDENTRFAGLNAKMQEFSAIVGLAGLRTIEQHIENRQGYAAQLKEGLGSIPGLSFQAIRPYVVMNYQNFAVLVDETEFGLSRDGLFTALRAENIAARKYFHPPLHKHDAYIEHHDIGLPRTERVANSVLCLPFYSEMSSDVLGGLCVAIERIQAHAPAVRRATGLPEAV